MPGYGKGGNFAREKRKKKDATGFRGANAIILGMRESKISWEKKKKSVVGKGTGPA